MKQCKKIKNSLFLSLNEEEKTKHFETLFEAFENLKDDNTKNSYFMDLFRYLDNKTQIELFKNCTSPSSENLKFAAEILKSMSVKELNLIFKGEMTLDEETILNSLRKTKACVVCENHNLVGGLYSAVSELLCSKLPMKVEKIGIIENKYSVVYINDGDTKYTKYFD